MKKIDLHIHTIKTISDAEFAFDLDALIDYVEKSNLDAIAITNHNIFDEAQYSEIASHVHIPVLPGIEINLDGGHLLLYAEPTDAHEFASRCAEVTKLIRNKTDQITTIQLKQFFGNLNNYLLIPHYDKTPEIPSDTLDNLREHISAGEVTSPKKFIYCQKTQDNLTPVYFSDCRVSLDIQNNPPLRQTYINCGDISISSLKAAFKDKRKVALTRQEGVSLFQVLDDGTEISTGLTVVIGERSSGKSFTLERILKTADNPKYIKQFSLVARDEEQDKARFKELLEANQSIFSQDYLKEFQTVLNDILNVDIASNDAKLAEYVESLKKHALEAGRRDAFSKCALFGEELYAIGELKGLEQLISSVKHLIENIDFRTIIDKHINIAALKSLIVELMGEYSRRDEENRKRLWINSLISDIKQQLQLRTSATVIKDIDLYRVATDLVKRKKFNELVVKLRTQRVIMRRDLHNFQLLATISPFSGAGELQRKSRSKHAFSTAFQFYDNAYQYLQTLKTISGLSQSDYYELFGKIEYKILNKDGAEVSGGERSEFYLLQEIGNAQQFDMLLIDEPESSFDNIFLKNEVNRIIKDISAIMPVVLVTHNSTIGASIKPDFILHTKKTSSDGNVKYSIFSGFPWDKELKSATGETIMNHEITLQCLEAGNEAYTERRGIYENLKN